MSLTQIDELPTLEMLPDKELRNAARSLDGRFCGNPLMQIEGSLLPRVQPSSLAWQRFAAPCREAQNSSEKSEEFLHPATVLMMLDPGSAASWLMPRPRTSRAVLLSQMNRSDDELGYRAW